MNSKIWKAVAMFMAMQGASFAHAQQEEEGRKIFSFNGFGTVGASRSSNPYADFTSTTFHPNGTGWTREWSPDLDTKLGFQINGNFTERLSGLFQFVTLQNYEGSYKPYVEWANLAYKITPDVTVRAGRTLWPMMLRSETQNVGYGNPFVRNTAELMANAPNSFSDGFDITYRYVLGSYINATTLMTGKSDMKAPGVSSTGNNYLNFSGIRGISHVSEVGDLKIHTAYMKMKYELLYSDFKVDKTPFSVVTLGFHYDPGKWFVTADMLKSDDKAFGKFTSLTAGGGVRFGNFTPYYTHSFIRQDSLGDGGYGNKGDRQAVNAIGVRWDFAKNMDLKIQYEKVKSGPIVFNTFGSLNNIQPEFFDSPKTNVISIVVDFVF